MHTFYFFNFFPLIIISSIFLMSNNYIKYKLKYHKLKKLKKKQFTNIKNNNRNMDEKKHIISLSEPWFTLISLKLKTVEGRKHKGLFKELKVGDLIEWTNDTFAIRKTLTKVIRKTEYQSFKEYLETEGIDKCLPGINDMDTALSVYYKYYSVEDEKKYGVIAIEIELV